MLWTVALLVPSILGLWLAAKHWYGWAISASSEFLWAAYSLHTHDTPLLIMSAIWLAVHLRNTAVAFNIHLVAKRASREY